MPIIRSLWSLIKIGYNDKDHQIFEPEIIYEFTSFFIPPAQEILFKILTFFLRDIQYSHLSVTLSLYSIN